MNIAPGSVVDQFSVKEEWVSWRRWKLYARQLAVPSKSNTPRFAALLLHGAGSAESSRVQPLAAAFARHGIPSISFDFVGHGRTGGHIGDTTLKDRTSQALTVAHHVLEPQDKLIVCGFSMSGHTAVRLARLMADRIVAVGLFCPAIYAVEAEDAQFGERFSEIIRRDSSWAHSPAIDDAREIDGRSYLCIGQQDPVIPFDVVLRLTSAFHEGRSRLRVDLLPRVGHQLANWLSSNDSYCDEIASYLIPNGA